MTSKQQSPVVHFTTSAEASLMEAIDSVINNLSADGPLPVIDFDFLRDYTVYQMQTRLLKLGYHDYTTQACLCVRASRYYYRNRKLALLKFTQIA